MDCPNPLIGGIITSLIIIVGLIIYMKIVKNKEE